MPDRKDGLKVKTIQFLLNRSFGTSDLLAYCKKHWQKGPLQTHSHPRFFHAARGRPAPFLFYCQP